MMHAYRDETAEIKCASMIVEKSSRTAVGLTLMLGVVEMSGEPLKRSNYMLSVKQCETSRAD